jgi:hypothetical protein
LNQHYLKSFFSFGSSWILILRASALVANFDQIKGLSRVGESSQQKADHGLSSMYITKNHGFTNGATPKKKKDKKTAEPTVPRISRPAIGLYSLMASRANCLNVLMEELAMLDGPLGQKS